MSVFANSVAVKVTPPPFRHRLDNEDRQGTEESISSHRASRCYLNFEYQNYSRCHPVYNIMARRKKELENDAQPEKAEPESKPQDQNRRQCDSYDLGGICLSSCRSLFFGC